MEKLNRISNAFSNSIVNASTISFEETVRRKNNAY